eukprot:TRINITY_DN4728_c0_g1_i1.p1 TRINITY_DN4728_c0_g1~~TRINITY_DN4728_c0_g1_i1.p1  ORF type:complete len:700 (+),score=174.72 TRINITY_DN4728_c0_g1_i1:64-2163(+)
MDLRFKTLDPLSELIELVNNEAKEFLSSAYADVAFPSVMKNREMDKGDFTMMLNAVAGKLKQNPADFSKKIADELTVHLATKDAATRFIQRVESARGYLNFFLNRPLVFRMGIHMVLESGQKYGHTKVMAGKKVIVEHTSSNPNAPLHIGNLRSTLIGGHLSKLLEAVGYDVKEYFFVNDLGAQIGLTALGYNKVYDKLVPSMKIDHWIGFMYAIMNTFSELQKLKQNIGHIAKLVSEGKNPLEDPCAEGVDPAGLAEYVDIFQDLRSRQPKLFDTLLDLCLSTPNIQQEAAELNLRYERNDPAAVKIFRKMVTDCLAGVQETLDTYSIKHQRFDFESELGWEGSNDRVLSFYRDQSPYYVPPTQCNAEGKPQGGHLNLAKFLEDYKYPTGKKGYQQNYPPLYVLRPDGSTLYIFRDVVYSLKKVREADLVLNVICSEQNLSQEKVQLALQLIDMERGRNLQHVSYELVKLSSGRMSGRRGRYVTADDLYEDLKEVLTEQMQKRNDAMPEEERYTSEHLDKVTHEIATAAMKYAILSAGARTMISFDVSKVTDFEDSSAPFLLYNSSRLNTLQARFAKKVDAGELRPLPSVSEIDTNLLNNQDEWELFMTYVISFPSVVISAGCPLQPPPPQLTEWPTSRICDFLTMFVRGYSSYYKHVRIINPADQESMHARLYLAKAYKQVMDNALRLLMIEPLEKM